MGDCIRSSARQYQRKSVQHYDFSEPHGNADDRSYLLLHGQGYQAPWRHFADGVQSRHTGRREPCRGPELKRVYFEQRHWLQLLSQPGRDDLEQIYASLIASILYADSTVANGSTYLLRGHRSRHLRA